MNRQEILEFINNIIEEEHGNRLTENQPLIESGLDSFGYAVLWTSTDYTLGIKFSEEDYLRVDHRDLTLGNMADMIGAKLKVKDEDKAI